MSCTRSLCETRVRDPSLRLGSLSSSCSSSTCSLKGELGKGSRISGGCTEKSTGESGAATEGIYASSRKRSKTEVEDREAEK